MFSELDITSTFIPTFIQIKKTMKKVSTQLSVLLAFSLLVFIACSKEGVNKNDDTGAVSQLLGGGLSDSDGQFSSDVVIAGLIGENTADKMKTAYRNQAGNRQTHYVAFSINDLRNFLNKSRAQHKADSIYVNFAMYTVNTARNRNDIGRYTIVFTPNKINRLAKNGNGISLQSEDDYWDLNHGNAYP